MDRARIFNRPMAAERLDENAVLDKAREKLKDIAKEQEGNDIDMNNFRKWDGDYPDSIVDNDLDDLLELEAEFAEISKLRTGDAEIYGKIFEQIVLEQFGKWIADNVSVQKASRFDDYMNGVDAVAEIKEPNETNYLALALDATHGNDVTKKLAKIKRQIETGRMSEVKYYRSMDGSFMGKLKQVPRVVIGADKNKVLELARLWVEGKEEELSNHPVQFQVFEEIILQLETFSNHARRLGKTAVAGNYQKHLEIFKEYRDDRIRMKGEPDYSYRSKDRSFMAIQYSVNNFVNLGTKK